jgi:tetratricopeptide (TPR) repeat protein
MPFIFDMNTSGLANYTSAQLEQARISSVDLIGVPSVSTPGDNETLTFPVTGGGSASRSMTEKRVGDLKETFDSRVEPDNSVVHHEAVVLALRYPGDLTIDQVCSIYSYLKNGDSSKKGWGYVRDPRGIDYFMYANETLTIGRDTVGGGDCDDFAILMSALIESIGGTTRIILARNNSTGGHAYAEVYLGQLGTQNSQVKEIINWLKQKYDTDKIYTHIDTDTKDVWLNLDWGTDEKGNAHPGGPFFQGDKHIVLCIRDTFEKTPLKAPEKPSAPTMPEPEVKKESNKPPRTISLTSDKTSPQGAGTAVTWTAEANDPDNDQILYRFFVNGLPVRVWSANSVGVWEPTDANIGDNQIEVRVRDGKHEGEESFDDRKSVSFTISGQKAAAAGSDTFDPSAWTDNGNALFKAGSYDEALKCFEKAIQLSPSYADAWYGKANVLVRQGKYEESIASLDKCIKIDPTNLAAWNNMGAASVELKRYDEALTCYEKAIAEDPTYAAPWSNKAEVLIKLGRYSEALDCCDKSLNIDSTNAFSWTMKGKALAALGKNNEALDCFSKALELDSEQFEAWNGKGMVLEKLGQISEANIAYAKAKELGYSE